MLQDYLQMQVKVKRLVRSFAVHVNERINSHVPTRYPVKVTQRHRWWKALEPYQSPHIGLGTCDQGIEVPTWDIDVRD